MNRETFIKRTYQFATGEANAPDSSSEDYSRIIDLANSFIDDWQAEPFIDWNSLFGIDTVGTASATDTYAIDTATIRKLVGVYFDETKTYIPLVRPVDQHPDVLSVARVGDNLVFSKALDDFAGQTIKAKYYGYAGHLTDTTSLVPVDNPMWLIYMTAAEFARNDYIKSGQYGNIVALAQNAMDSMKADNNAGVTEYVTHGDFTPLGETME